MENTLIVYEDVRCEDLVLMHWLGQLYNNFETSLIDKLTDSLPNSLVIADYDLPIPKNYKNKIFQYKDLAGANFSYEHLFSVLEDIISNHNIKVIYMHGQLLFSEQKTDSISIGTNAKNMQKLMELIKRKRVALINANQVRQAMTPAHSSSLSRVSHGVSAMSDVICEAKLVNNEVKVSTLKSRTQDPATIPTFTIKRQDIKKEQIRLKMKKLFD